MGGISAGNAAAYQATVARQNAVIASQNAQRAAMATSSQTTDAGLKARSQDAMVRAAGAANNLDVNTGSPVDVQTSQREVGALDVANTAERGALATYGYETQASGESAQANLAQSQVIPDYLGGALGGVGSLLSASPNLPSNYSWMAGGGTQGGSSGSFGAPWSSGSSSDSSSTDVPF
jgi:hypothetical protein